MNPEKPFFKNADQGAYKSATLVVRQYKRQTPHQNGDQAVAVIAANYGKSMTVSVEIAGGVKAQKFIIISNKCVVTRLRRSGSPVQPDSNRHIYPLLSLDP